MVAVTNGVPIVADRAMYRSLPGQPFSANQAFAFASHAQPQPQPVWPLARSGGLCGVRGCSRVHAGGGGICTVGAVSAF
jgi:hypothetical protein